MSDGNTELNYRIRPETTTFLNVTVENVTSPEANATTLNVHMYILHCAIVPASTVLYCWVLFVLLRWRSHFANPFYKLAAGLGACSVYNNLWLCYVFAFTYLGRSPFRDERGDTLFCASIWAVWYANFYFQVVIATNRLLAIVCYESYLLLFTIKATVLCCFVCFAVSAVQIAPLFGAHPVKFNLNEGLERFVDQTNEFALVWELVDEVLTAVVLLYIVLCYAITLCFVRSRLRTVANRMALTNEIKLTAASFCIVLMLIAYNAAYHFEIDARIVRTFECALTCCPPYLYLLFDRKLRRRMLWCQCVRKRLYTEGNNAFETLTVSGRKMSGRVNKKYKRMRAANQVAASGNSNSDNGNSDQRRLRRPHAMTSV